MAIEDPKTDSETLQKADDPPLTDGDLALAVPRLVGPAELLRLGALTLEQERSDAIESLITDQQQQYREALKQRGPEALIQALADRDRLLAQTGRDLATGRTQGRLLREFVRGLLQYADHSQLRAIGDATKAGKIEGILVALGAEPTDLQQLKKQGSTLGPLEDPAGRAEDLASGRRLK